MNNISDRPFLATLKPPKGGLSRRELLTLVSAVMALMALGIDIILPAFDDVREAFGLREGSTEPGKLITFYFIGIAFSQLIFGPLADRFGRKKILYIGIFIYMIGAAGSALATSMNVLLLFRVIWGVGAAGARVVATAVIRDRFEGNIMAKAMSEVMAVFVLVPVIAPSLGAGLMSFLPWQSIFWFCLIWAIVIFLWSLRLQETLKIEDTKSFDWRTTRSSYSRVIKNRICFSYTLASIFLQAVFVMYLTCCELMIGDILDRGDQFSVIFGCVASSFAFGALLNGQIVIRYGIRTVLRSASLFLILGSSILLVITLLGNGVPNFWIFIPMLAIVLSNFMFIMPNLNTAALQPVGDIAGSASALTSASRMGFGALLGGVVGSQVQISLTPFVLGTLIFTCLTTLFIYRAEPSKNEPVI
ncbi:MAG: multidrug effflux MFS transporter [Acidimicrobiales bacterium]|nr:multidrug effflux MFS transporter [Acidimicrobiales bacterium]